MHEDYLKFKPQFRENLGKNRENFGRWGWSLNFNNKGEVGGLLKVVNNSKIN